MNNPLSNTNELMDRARAKRHQLQARIAELRADGRETMRSEIEALQAKLNQIEAAVSDAVKNATEKTAKKLNDLLN